MPIPLEPYEGLSSHTLRSPSACDKQNHKSERALVPNSPWIRGSRNCSLLCLHDVPLACRQAAERLMPALHQSAKRNLAKLGSDRPNLAAQEKLGQIGK
eukprot:3221171-Pleurochrysis_carterae.AAC.2